MTDEKPRERKGYQRRSFTLANVRASDGGSDGKATTIDGYAAVFGEWAEIQDWWFGYKERIQDGAFTKTLKEADVRALFNHNPDWVLGRNKAGTLTLREDNHGLASTILPPDTQWARDLVESMRRGDINQMSFGFEVVKDMWVFSKDPTVMDERTILEVKLWDVSIVTYPAYAQTEASVRTSIAALQRYLAPPEPGRKAHSADLRREPLPPEQHSLDAPPAVAEAAPPTQPTAQTSEPTTPGHSEPEPVVEPKLPLHSINYYRQRLLLIEAGIQITPQASGMEGVV
jgi:HK97 family phage prohead protease